MNCNFGLINQYERPILILKRPDRTPIGVLGYAADVKFEPNYNELSVLSFRLPATVDGKPTPFYDDVVGLMIVELKDIGQFVISAPETSGGKRNQVKNVSAKSIECEFGRKKLSLPESTYKFFDTTNPDGTVLGMIMEQMPAWRIGSVSANIANKYRTFSVSNENLYNFMKGTAQEAFNCIFEFDTMNLTVSVRDADEEPKQKQVYISRDNLAKDIKITEETDDIVTRLDVSGADGVDIRDVNPTGTNRIINLDYFMNRGFFPDELRDKYEAWTALVEGNKLTFYNYAVQYSLKTSEETAERAKLADLRGEYTSLENIQAVIIQGIASKIRTQADLDTANRNLAAKQQEINAKQAEINNIAAEKDAILGYMRAITSACAFEQYFTAEERTMMSPYLIDNEVSESSFVASDVQSYSDGEGNQITSKRIEFSGGTITSAQTAAGATLYSISDGNLSVDGIMSGRNISAVVEQRPNGKIVLSAYSGNGEYNGSNYPSACLSVSGTGSVSSGSTLVCTVTGSMFFSLNATDYEKKTVAWDLYEYGEALLRKMSQPSYSFSVDSANFIALEDFLLFKNELELGQRIYIEASEGRILQPICTGAKVYWFERPRLELLFTDTYTATDSQSKLVDIFETSVSMGKTLDSGKFTYEAWTGSGASTELKNFIDSALDTSKNAIMSSTDQAVSWDGAGLRLRQYSDASKTAYAQEQIWMSNNSIMMTDDGWATAKMAIGKFTDDNTGEQWGILAPMIVGTLLAGSELVIESEKKSGGNTVFRVDGDGAKLYNAQFQIQKTTGSTTTQILLDPSVGIAMGTYPVANDGVVDTNNAKFWVDTNGTMHLTGTIETGDGHIGGWTIKSGYLYAGDGASRVELASSGTYRIWAGNETAASAPFSVQQDGTLTAKAGTVGGWYIGSDYIGNANAKASSTVGMASGTGTDVVFWAGGAQSSAPFKVLADGTITGTKGTVGGWYIGSDYIGNASTKDASTVGMASGTGTSVVFWAGGAQASAPFRVQADGKIYASNLEITGGSIKIGDKFTVSSDGAVTATDLAITGGAITIGDDFAVSSDGKLTATAGSIGGWYIGSDYLGNASTKKASTIGMAAGTGNDVVFWAGGVRNEEQGKTRAPFRVEADGDLYASNGTFGGTVYATQVSTANGALVSSQIGKSEIKTININATAVTESKIASNAVSGGKIAGNSIAYKHGTTGVQTSLTNGDTAYATISTISWDTITWVYDVSLKDDGSLDVKKHTAKMYGVGWIS